MAKQDFDASELVKADQHEKDINVLGSRVAALEKRLGTNEQLANTLFEASQTALKLRAMIGKVLIELIQKDTKTRSEIHTFIDKADRDNAKLFWKKFGGSIWTGIVFVLGVVVTIIIQKFAK